jgi:hypothetical protein
MKCRLINSHFVTLYLIFVVISKLQNFSTFYSNVHAKNWGNNTSNNYNTLLPIITPQSTPQDGGDMKNTILAMNAMAAMAQ